MPNDQKYEQFDEIENKEEKKKFKCTCGKICCACLCIFLLAIIIGMIILTVMFGGEAYTVYSGYKSAKSVYENLNSDNPDYTSLVTKAVSSAI